MLVCAICLVRCVRWAWEVYANAHAATNRFDSWGLLSHNNSCNLDLVEIADHMSVCLGVVIHVPICMGAMENFFRISPVWSCTLGCVLLRQHISPSICYFQSVSHACSPHHPIMPSEPSSHPIMPSASSPEELFVGKYFTKHPPKSWNHGRFFQHCRDFSGNQLSDCAITNLYRRSLFQRHTYRHACVRYHAVSF